MTVFLLILALLAMFAVLVVLGMGFFSLARGGEFRAKWSNKLMRMRVLFQAIALVLLFLVAWLVHNHS